ncbi:ABC transporter ATP-binding protein [Arcanobacterium sp. S3PF19]|uniref:ABC transporter ATP-binding protein n=1 Tax=Arcanobacterium sp. S3PF19 TaxID=1219585 RepID=UPI00050FD3FB|nr:ABC transporter ATP-binding protein [Arcanobacterium sp. S3PF19]KGF05892.1 ATP-binding protein [Arcanobacterium sp. S3PF19]
MELTIEDLAAGYGRHTVLDGVNVRPMKGGRLVGVLGTNACGKTTLIKTVAGIHRRRRGLVRLRIGGNSVDLKKHRRQIGYVPQDLPHTAALRVFEAVLITARREAEGDPVGRTAEILHALEMDTYAQSFLSDISGGQRQMTALAQMMVGKPALMLLDEPTSALDLSRRIFVLDAVREKARRENSLALAALHDINLAAAMCDELIVLSAGRVLVQGSPAQVLTPQVLRSVYGVEADVLRNRSAPVVAAYALSKSKCAAPHGKSS